MAKTYNPLSKAFSTHFKQAIKKSDVFNIAASEDGYIYFVNGVIAGRIHKVFYSDILQPLTLREMPVDGSAVCISGNRSAMDANSIFSMVKKIIEAAEKPLIDTGLKIRIDRAKNEYAEILQFESGTDGGVAVNEKLFSVIDLGYSWILKGYNPKSPVVASITDQIDIAICPMNLGAEKTAKINSIVKLLRAEA